jgi:hypothetical protein
MNVRGTGVRPAVRRLAVVCFVVLLPAAAHALWDYVEMRRLANAIDDLRQRGEPVSRTLLERSRRPATEEDMRAARYYNAAAALAFRGWGATHPVANLPRDGMIERGRQTINAVGKARAIAADAADRLRSIASEYGDALATADRAADLSFAGYPPYFFDGDGRNYGLEDLTIAASARTLTAIADGRAADAAESLHRSLELRRALTRSVPWVGLPLIDLQLLLENTEVPQEMLAKLQVAFADAERPDAVQQGLRETRADVIQTMWARLYGKGADPNTPASNIRIGWDPWNLSRPWIARELRRGFAVQQQVLEAAERPWPEKLPALARVAPDPPGDPRPGTDVLWFNKHLPWTFAHELAPAEGRKLASTRAAETLLAIARYRQEHHVPPDRLEALVPAYLAAVPADPFTGQALRYRADSSRIIVYSVDADGNDDGGAVGELRTGWSRETSKDTGIEIRLR